MTNLGVARIRLEADDSRLVATLSQLPGKVTAILNLVETRSKAQMGRSGSVAGNTFAQSLAVAAQAAVKSVELISGQAGKAGGEALGRELVAGAKNATSGVNSALGAAGRQSGNSYTSELSRSLRGVKLPAVSGGKVTVGIDLTKFNDNLFQLPRQTSTAFAQVQLIAKAQSLQAGSNSGSSFREKYVAGVQGVLNLLSRPLAAIASVSRTAAENAATQSGTAFSTQLANTILQNTGMVERSVRTALQGTILTSNALGQISGQTYLRSMSTTLLQSSGSFQSAGSSAGQNFNQGAKNALNSGSSGLVAGAVRPFYDIGSKIGSTMRTQLRDVGRGMGERIGQNITDGVMRGLAGAASALGSIKNLGDFDAAARKANTLTDDIDALKKGAFELAKEIKNTATATEILNAAEPVLSSGVTKTADVLKVLKASQIGAIGGFTDIATVADATTTIMSSFGLSADRASDIVQRMAGVQNAGKIQIGQAAGQYGKLTSAIALFGGTYDKAGLSMVEVDGLIANATAKGVRVSSAFDGIRQAISSIGAPTKEASDEAKKLGIQFDAVTLQSKGITGILQSLAGSKGAAKELDAIAAASAKAAKAAGGIDTGAGKAAAAKAGQEAAKSAASMLKLFGSVEAVSALAASSGKKGLEDLAKAMEVIAKTDASAAFEKVRNGINQQQKAFGNRVIDLDVKIKSGFVGDMIGAGLGIANKAMDAIINTVEKLNQAYVRLSPQAQGVVKAIGGVVAITATVTAGIIAVGAAVAIMGGALSAGIGLVGAIAVGLGSLVVAAAPLAAPLLGAGTAVYALSKALGATDSEAFRDAMIAAGGVLALVFGPAVIGAVVAGIAPLATVIGSVVIAAAPLAVPLLAAGAAVYGLSKAFGATDGEAFRNSLIAIGAGLALVFGPAAIGAVAAGVTALVTGFASIAIAAAAALIPLLPWIAAGAAVALALYGLYKAFEFAKPTLQSWGVAFKGAMDAAVSSTVKFAKDVGAAIGGAIKWFVDLSVESAKWLAAVSVAVGNWASDVVAGIARWASPFTNLVSNAWNKFTSATGSAISSAWNAIAGFVSRSIDGFNRWVAGFAASVGNFVRQNFLIQATVRGAGDTIKFFGDISTRTFKLIVDGGNFLAREIKAQFDGIVESVSRVINWFKDLPGAIKRSTDAINNFNNTRPSAPAAPPQPRSAAPRQSAPVINEQVAFSGLGDGIVSDSPQPLFARRPAPAQNTTQPPPPAPPTMVEVMSSVYYPGGRQTPYEGGEIDARNRRLTNQDKAIAIPGLNRPDGIPYGSRVRVTNPANGLSTEADVRDAGPFKPGRQMDITGAVAKEIKFSGLGILQVEIVKLAPGADPNRVYQFGEATKFRETKTSTIAPGSSLALSQPQPQLPVQPDSAQRATPPAPAAPRQTPPVTVAPAPSQVAESRINAARTDGERLADQAEKTIGIYRKVGLQCATTVREVARLAGVKLPVTDRPADANVVGNYTNPARANSFGGPNDQIITNKSELRRGDIVQWADSYAGVNGRKNDNEITHVGIYMGDGKYYHHSKKQGGRITGDPGFRFARGIRPNAQQQQAPAAPPETSQPQAEDAKLIRALENAQRDRNIASMGLEDLRRNRPIANQRVTGKGRRRRVVGKSQSELDSAYNTRLAAAEEKLRDADDKLLSAQEAISKNRTDQAEAAKKAEIAAVQTRASDITSTTTLRIQSIDRKVAEGEQALALGKPLPANALTEEEGIKRKNALLAEQRRQFDQLKPRINELAAKYKDPESQQALKQIAENVESVGRAAAESAAEIARTPIGAMEQKISAKISALQLQNLSTDFGVAKNPTDANRLAGEETKSTVLTKMADELQSLLPEAEKLMEAYKDPESKRRLEEIVKIIQQQGIEALTTAKNVQIGKVDSVKSEASAIQNIGEREQQSIRNQYDMGSIKTEIELTDKLNQSRLTTASLLEQLIPRLLALRAAQTDPGIIESINEQIAGVSKYRAEVTAAVRDQAALKQQNDLAFQSTKAATQALGEGIREAFRSALKGALDLNSALDSILNKIADIGIDSLINLGIKSLGIPGFKAGGEVQNFNIGGQVLGDVQNFSTGGQVLGAIQAVDRALTKEGPSAVLAALTPGEQVLEKSKDAPLYRAMVSDGTWAKMRSSYNYSAGGTVAGRAATHGQSSYSAMSGSGSGSRPSVVVTEINSVQYVSVDQLQQIMEIQMPLAARAGAALVERNMTQSSWRQQYNL